MLSGSMSAKAVRRTLMKLTPENRLINGREKNVNIKKQEKMLIIEC